MTLQITDSRHERALAQKDKGRTYQLTTKDVRVVHGIITGMYLFIFLFKFYYYMLMFRFCLGMFIVVHFML